MQTLKYKEKQNTNENIKELSKVGYLAKISLSAQTSQTVEFMFLNVAYRATIFKTGHWALQPCH